MSYSQILLYAGILVPGLLYSFLITHVFHHLLRHKAQPAADLAWAKSIEVERRREMIGARSAPLLAYKLLLTCQGSDSLLTHFTEDVQLTSPLLMLDGREEMGQVVRALCGTVVEDVVLDIVSLHQNEELMRLEMEMMITPRYLPSFTLPVNSHLYFEQEGDQQKIYKIREEWYGVPGINERTSHRATAWLHSWLRRSHAVILTVLSGATGLTQ